jgi:transposase
VSSGSRRTGWASRARASAWPGKSDQIDALAIARVVVKDGIEQFPVAYLDEQAMEIRLIADHRADLVAERTRTVNRLRWHLVTLSPQLERSLNRKALNNAHGLDRLERQLRKLPSGARTQIARRQLAQIRRLNRQIEDLETRLHELIEAHRPQLLAELGCGPVVAAILIDPHRRRRALPLRRQLRAAVGHRPDPVLLRKANPVPPQPRR